MNLKTPTDYIGPAMVFGHPGDESAGIPEEARLPMFVPVEDSNAWLPDKHDKSHTPGPLPATLKEAVRVFVLVCAARACRGDADVHNSMLVHATRFVNVQGRVAEQLENELVGLRNLISSGMPAESRRSKPILRTSGENACWSSMINSASAWVTVVRRFQFGRTYGTKFRLLLIAFASCESTEARLMLLLILEVRKEFT